MRQATTDNIAKIAREAGEAGDRGQPWFRWPRGGETFDLNETGYCTRFVRQVHEAALDIAPFHWQFASPHARALEAKLKDYNKQISHPVPGDIICINGGSGQYGHVGINLGNGEFAENTSSGRGPGTTVSPIRQVRHRITGYYRAVPLAEQASGWSKPAREWAIAQKLISGYGDGDYGWQQPVTREELLTILKRYDEREV